MKKGSKITSIAQLKGKKVGFVQNTTAQYFLNALLVQNGLTFKDITAAPLLPAAGVAALTCGHYRRAVRGRRPHQPRGSAIKDRRRVLLEHRALHQIQAVG